MAKPPGAMDVVHVARVDPEVQAVAVFQAGIAAPDRLPFAFDAAGDGQSRFAPGRADFDRAALPFQLAEVGQAVLPPEAGALLRPERAFVAARGRKAKKNRFGSNDSDMLTTPTYPVIVSSTSPNAPGRTPPSRRGGRPRRRRTSSAARRSPAVARPTGRRSPSRPGGLA